MDGDPRNFFNLLYQQLDDLAKGPEKCQQILKNFSTSLTQDQVNSALLDLYLQHMFKKPEGLLKFICSCLKSQKFKSAIIEVFEIVYTLLNNFGSKLERHVLIIHEICGKVTKSSLVTADEKVKAFEVLILSFEKTDKSIENSDHYKELNNDLLNSISLKKTPTVEEKVLIALGVFAKRYPLLVSDPSHLKALFYCGIEKQMVQKDVSHKTTSGYFTGLYSLCESFPLDTDNEEDRVIRDRICRFILELSVPTSQIKVGNRAALNYLTKYILVFIDGMIDSVEIWHRNLLKWLNFGPEDRKTAVRTLEAFYRGLGHFFRRDALLQYNAAFLSLMKYFKNILKEDAVYIETKLTLQGLCAFSEVCHSRLTEIEMKDLLMLVVHNFEKYFILDSDPPAAVLEYLPNYLQTICKMVYLRRVTNSELFCLQKGVVLMIKSFPNLPYSCHSGVFECIVTTCYFLSKNSNKVYEGFLDHCVYQGVVWSCSHQHISEAELIDAKIVTVKDYLPLWKALLNIVSFRGYDKFEIFLNDRKYLVVTIIDKLIRTLILLVNKLNANIVQSKNDEPVTEIRRAYEVAEISDFAIFLNVVDFYEQIFLQIDPEILRKCISKLIRHLIEKCMQYPLISGYYKLLMFCLKIAFKLDYFKDLEDQDSQSCYVSLQQFIGLLLDRLRHFKDELLSAGLQVLLEYPVSIIRGVLPSCVTIFKTIFTVAKSYSKLIYVTLDTLEYWMKTIPSQELQALLIEALPMLDSFLQSKSLNLQIETTQTRRKTAQLLKNRKVVVGAETELANLQQRILLFIGQQNVSICQAIVNAESNIQLAVWGSKQHLKVTLPFQDGNLDFYLDKLIPRIINLALNSNDRRTRVTACELLHGIVMVFLGTTKQMPQSTAADLDGLLQHLSVPLLKLGCDLDPVVQQLFQPLCFQLIHWYTHTSQLRTNHSVIIIEAILENICHPTDATLRDFSGKCVNEFVSWTIKQSSEKRLAKDPANIQYLLDKVRFYSTHPDSSKKLGASLIFNNIYRQLREESSLLSMFWVEFLYVFVKSLESLESDDEHCIAQITDALSHLERGFAEKAALFLKQDSNRKVPDGLGEGTLDGICIWLFEHAASRNIYCRRKCIDLFSRLITHTKGYKNIQTFVDQKSICFKNEYSNQADLNPIESMRDLLCKLDTGIFAAKNHLLTETATLSDSIDSFFSETSVKSLDGVLATNRSTSLFERQIFDKLKSQAALQILELCNSVIYTHPDFLNSLLNANFWNFIINMVFNQERLGFQEMLADDSVIICRFLKSLSEENLAIVTGSINNYVEQKWNFKDLDLRTHVNLEQRNIFKGLQMLQSFKVLHLDQFKKGLVETVLSKFCSNFEGEIIYASDLQDTTVQFYLSILNLCLDDEDELLTLVQFLHKPYKVITGDSTQSLNFGSYMLSIFEDSIIPRIFANFDLFLQKSLSCSCLDQTVELIMIMLRHLSDKRNKHLSKNIIGAVLSRWNVFENYFNESSSTLDLGLNFAKCFLPFVQLNHFDLSDFKKWFSSLLALEVRSVWQEDIDFKIEVFYLFATVCQEEDVETLQIEDGLGHLHDYFFLPNTLRYFQKLCCVIPQIKCSSFFLFLIDIYLGILSEVENNEIDEQFRDFIRKGDKIVLDKTVSKLYELYFSEDYNSSQIHQVHLLIVTMLQHCSEEALDQLAVVNIERIMQDLGNPTSDDNLYKKMLYFGLFEVLFSRRPVDLNEDLAPIAKTLKSSSNKLFVVKILKHLLDAIKDKVDSVSGDDLRKYKRQAYNAAISLVSNSIKDANFYNKLFIRQEDDIDILWQSLIDLNKNYTFETDFENIPKQRRVLLNIRNQIRENKVVANAKYMDSMRIYSSSLCEDFNKFDFSNNVLRSTEETDVDEIKNEIELDCTDVNNHENMAHVCGLIRHVFNDGIFELPDEDEDHYEPPLWIKGLVSLLLADATHKNVKIFWIKVIDNTIDIFNSFSRWLLEPLLKFIVDLCAGSHINYFVADVVAILSTWSAKTVPTTNSEVGLASNLIVFLIENLCNERADVFKYHLDLIRLLVESWKASFAVPYDSIQFKLAIDPLSRKVEVGVHLTSIFLANHIFPWRENSTDFCKLLFNIIMKSSIKSTYKPCAETLGLLLHSTPQEANFEKINKNLHVLLSKLKDPEKYALVLEALVIHYPQAANDFHLKLIFSRIQELPKLRAVYLRIILKRLDIMETIEDFKQENWHNYIETDSLEVQLLTLEIVYKSLDLLGNCQNYHRIIEATCRLVSSSNALCRMRMFDIAMQICQKFGRFSDICTSVLVQGLTDTDLEINAKVYQFWKNFAALPDPIATRFAYIMKHLYTSETEGDFLGYASHILLDVIRKSDDFDSLLFAHPLEDCDFEDYHLETNWRSRHLSFVPLFTESLRSQDETFSSSEMVGLRETANTLEFAPTQSLIASQYSQYIRPESSLLIDRSFVNPNLVNLSHKYKIPKRRFLRDKEKTQKYFAQQAVQRNVAQAQQRKDVAKEQENKVVIYRQYRKGDLPDVQITLEALLLPLQNLVLSDSETAEIVMLQVYKRIIKKNTNDLTFSSDIASGIQIILESSSQYDRILFRALLDMVLNSGNTIKLPPELVASISRKSGLTNIGVNLLETYINSYDGSSSSSKRVCGQLDAEVTYWMKLAELQRDLHQWDDVKSIFLEKLGSPDLVKRAVLAEANTQWRDAQDLYKTLITSDCSAERKDFYYESYFKCFAYLGEWKELGDSIAVVAGGEDNLWSNLWGLEWNKAKLLPWYMDSQVKYTLSAKKHSNQFLWDLNEILNGEHCHYLQQHFSEQLAVLWIFQNEMDEASLNVNLYLKQFLDTWQQMNPLYSNRRYDQLLKLRNVVDMHKFIDVLTNFNEVQVENLVAFWERIENEHLLPITLCEERVLYRRLFIDLLSNKIGDEAEEAVASQLAQIRSKLYDNLLNVAINDNNFYMARKCIKDSLNQDKLKNQLYSSRTVFIKASLLQNSGEKLDILMVGCKPLYLLLKEKTDDKLKLLTHLQLFDYLAEMSSVLSENASLLAKKEEGILSLLGEASIDSADGVSFHGAKKLRKYIETYENGINSRMDVDGGDWSDDCTLIANAYAQLAYFAKNQGPKLSSDFMIYVFRAMKFNSAEGRQLFPCILMGRDFTDEDTKRFVEESQSIPVWMFLGWIPQILVHIGSSKESAITDIALKIANLYPQAIVYAYRLSKDNFEDKLVQSNALIKQLDALLLHDIKHQTFLKALSFVGIPVVILLYYVKKLKKACQLKDENGLKSTVNTILEDLFSSSQMDQLKGSMFKKISKYEREIRNINGVNKKSIGIIDKIDVELNNILRSQSEAKKNSSKLEDYSPWLANFSANEREFNLEIPGQYDGNKMPLLQYHIKISGFNTNVSIMSSLRKPIKVIIVGNDTKEYPFLIKFGEDVRQDQRIQQLFGIMNTIFSTNKKLMDGKFSIWTYQVVPLTSKLGIIQWVDDTTPLASFISKVVDSTAAAVHGKAEQLYCAGIYKPKNLASVDAFGRAALNHSRDRTIAKYRELVHMIQWDVLRSAFRKISANTESFCALRENFIKSFAILCVCQWILGVGDRHLSNFLVSLKSGKILGIDFGHAFGSATQFLPVPELVPFRLTPHIIALMEPLGEKGIFREVMVHSLEALRKNSSALLSTMNVFIEEPSLDWIENASRNGEAAQGAQWYPSQKLDQVKRKLNGAKSTDIMVEDLRAGHQGHKNYMEAYIKLVLGNPDHDARARFDDQILSAEDQADCLIDHATDYNLLGRMYEGWKSWI